jgi:hypothetical protein
VALRCAKDWTISGTAPGRFGIAVPPDAEPTRPYWSRESEYHDHLYTLDRPEHVFLPDAPAECEAEFRYRIDGEEVTARQRLETETLDRVWGPRRRALVVVPALSLSLQPRHLVLPAGKREFRVRVELRANRATEGKVRLKMPEAWRSEPAEAAFTTAQADEVRSFEFSVTADGTGTVDAVAEAGGRTYNEGYTVAGYRGLEPRHLFRPARAEVRRVDVRIAPICREQAMKRHQLWHNSEYLWTC